MFTRILLLLLISQIALCTNFAKLVKPNVRSDIPTNVPWEVCQTEVCEEVKDQTEGLVRLKLMRRYLTETMNLMSELVTSMDAEIVESGNKLSEFIGPNCLQIHSILNELTKHSLHDLQAARKAGLTSAMSMGIEQHDDNSTEDFDDTTYYPKGTNSGLANKHQGSKVGNKLPQSNTKQYVAPSYPKAPNYDHHHSREELDESNEFTNQDHLITGSSSGYKNSKQLGTSKFNYNKNTHHQHNPHHQPSKHNSHQSHAYSTPGSQGNSQYSNSGSTGYRQDLHSSSSSLNTLTFDPNDKSNCKGVPRGSPHWVPGIDNWCKQNCALGYCPKTHCVC